MLEYAILVVALALWKDCSATAASGCRSAKADIVFLLDKSGSVGNNNFEIQKEFVANFSKTFDIGPNDVQVSVVTFSTFPQEEFKLNSNRNLPQLLAAIHRINYTQGATLTHQALFFARNKSFTAAAGDRHYVTNILIIMTDGRSNVPTLTSIESNLVHKLDIQVIAIGIGKAMDRTELQTMASGPQYVFPIKSFDALYNALNIIQNATCNIEAKFTTTKTASGAATNNPPTTTAITTSTKIPTAATTTAPSTTKVSTLTATTLLPTTKATPTQTTRTKSTTTPSTTSLTTTILSTSTTTTALPSTHTTALFSKNAITTMLSTVKTTLTRTTQTTTSHVRTTGPIRSTTTLLSTTKATTISSGISSKHPTATTKPKITTRSTRIMPTTMAVTPGSPATTTTIKLNTPLLNTYTKIATSTRSTLNETVVEVADKTHIMVCILVGSILTVLILIFIIKQHCTFPGKHKKGKMSIDALDF